MTVLAVIPARGESKGIVLKNLQPLLGRPMLAYAIEAAKACPHVHTVLVSTDSERIAEVAKQYGAVVPFLRPPELSRDDVTLDPVVYHAVQQAEDRLRERYDVAACIQPTCPLLTSATITAVLQHMDRDELDTAIAVTEDRHLVWTPMPDGTYYQQERLNRQWLPPTYREAGAVLASRRHVIAPHSRIGGKVGLVLIDRAEALDVDDHLDLWQAQLILRGRQSVRETAPVRLVATLERPLPTEEP